MVVKVHPEIAGYAAASASWLTDPRGFQDNNRGTMVRPGLGWWPSVGWLGLSPLAHGVGAFRVRCRPVGAKKMDLPCASGSGSTFSHARRGDRTIEAWPLSFYTPSCLGLPVVIIQSDAFEPRPHGATEPTRAARIGGHLPPGAFHTDLACPALPVRAQRQISRRRSASPPLGAGRRRSSRARGASGSR